MKASMKIQLRTLYRATERMPADGAGIYRREGEV